MAHRFPLDKAPDPSVRQRFEQLILEAHGNHSHSQVSAIEEDGQSMSGPYAAFSYTPDVASDFLAMGKTAFSPNHVRPRMRELAILAMCSVIDAPYIRDEHIKLSNALGLTTEQCNDAVAGVAPKGLSEEETAGYELGRLFSTITRPLEDEAWENVTLRMQKSEIVGIANIIGGYKWLALLVQING
ncbi:AhpD-like protein [Hypoxylon sp. FL1284]|nr:AhpD-like protein [Hypoxylon sp. FL1284]